MWEVHTTEYYLATKKNKAPIYATMWKGLETNKLSKRSQTHNVT
jgi:hypothetical protein